MAECTTDECGKPAWQCGLCHGCYSRKRRTDKRASGAYRRLCTVCAEPFSADRPTRKVCSATCRAVLANNSQRSNTAARGPLHGPRRAPSRECAQCGDRFVGTGKYCATICLRTAGKSRSSRVRSPWRVAVDNGDATEIIAVVSSSAVHDTLTGCWLWPSLDRAGYPTAGLGNGSVGVHRIVLEAVHGKRLGSQHAHHACATPACVRPDHLQPATYAENLLEMKSRGSYVRRIAELEDALASLDPRHPLLQVIPLAKVG